ncbi:MAG: hypothetical protein ABIR94_21605, partial [Rubrivivax sp.]
VIPATIENELRNWGLADSYGGYSARAILYGDAISLANRYWPLGSGLGTFASVGSIRFDQSLFNELGYGAFWWFTARSFLQDAFWSKYIAETGWLGFLAHVGVYLLVLRAVLGWLRSEAASADPELFRRIVFAAVGLVFVIITSPTANALAEVHGALFPLMYVGIAWQQIVAARKATPAPPRP